MKVYISADMEGVTGVTHPQDVIPCRPRYEQFRRSLTADVNAAIDGAGRAGASDFIVNEAHDGMRNIVLEDLDPRAEIIVGQRKPLVMMEGVEGADICFFVGYHARAGVEGVLSHTYSSPNEVIGVQLNGEPCSEARMNAAFAGSLGIPVGLVTGDDRTCGEAESLYAGVRTARVKTAIDRYTARCLALTRRASSSRRRRLMRYPQSAISAPTPRKVRTPSRSSSQPQALRLACSTSPNWNVPMTGS